MATEELCPKNESLNYTTILQMGLLCKNQGQCSEVPYTQTFLDLYQEREIRKDKTKETRYFI